MPESAPTVASSIASAAVRMLRCGSLWRSASRSASAPTKEASCEQRRPRTISQQRPRALRHPPIRRGLARDYLSPRRREGRPARALLRHLLRHSRRAALHRGRPRTVGPRPGPRLPRRLPLHPRHPAHHVSWPPLDHAPVRRLRHRRRVQPPLPISARAAAPPASPSPSTCPRRWATTPITRWPRARSARSASRSAASKTCDTLFDGIPLETVSTSMTINATAAILLSLYIAVAKEQGVDVAQALRHRAERHPQGIHRARHLYLSRRARPCASSPTSSATAPTRCRAGTPSPSPATTSARPAPPPRKRSASPSPTASPTSRAAARGRARRRRVRRPALLLLQRPQQLLRGGRQVPRRAPHVGAHHARALRRQRPALRDAALPHPDRRLHAHRPAAGEQHRPHRATRRWPPCWAARSPCTPIPSTRRSPYRPRTPCASPCAPSRSSPTRPASPTPSIPSPAPTYVESLTDELETPRLGVHRTSIDDARRQRPRRRAGLYPARDRRGRLSPSRRIWTPSASDRRRRQQIHRSKNEPATRRSCASTPSSVAAGRQAGRSPRPPRQRRRRHRPRRPRRRRPRQQPICCRASSPPSKPSATLGEISDTLRGVFGEQHAERSM